MTEIVPSVSLTPSSSSMSPVPQNRGSHSSNGGHLLPRNMYFNWPNLLEWVLDHLDIVVVLIVVWVSQVRICPNCLAPFHGRKVIGGCCCGPIHLTTLLDTANVRTLWDFPSHGDCQMLIS